MRYAPRHRKPQPPRKWATATGAVAMSAAFPLATTGPIPAISAHTVSSNTPDRGNPVLAEYVKPRPVTNPVRAAHHKIHHRHHHAPVVDRLPVPSERPSARISDSPGDASLRPESASKAPAAKPSVWHSPAPVKPSVTVSEPPRPVQASTPPVHASATATIAPPRPAPVKITPKPTPTFTPHHTVMSKPIVRPTTGVTTKPVIKVPAVAKVVGAAKAIAFATAQLGKPYIYGGNGPTGYDCSGLTTAAWKAAGVTIPRTSSAQYSGLRHVSVYDMEPGDILVFYHGASHVGLYIGGGMMIHAPHTGEVIQKTALAGYYMQNLIGVVRP